MHVASMLLSGMTVQRYAAMPDSGMSVRLRGPSFDDLGERRADRRTQLGSIRHNV